MSKFSQKSHAEDRRASNQLCTDPAKFEEPAPALSLLGVATQLISQVVSYARAKQHDVIWLGTSADNARAIGLYRKSGFHHVGDALLNQAHGDHEDVIMCCEAE
jgi:L-amino acid N-acyltransferase YncA